MAVGSSLARAVRQQGQRCLAALRPSVTEAQAQQGGPWENAQQAPCGALLADAHGLRHACAAFTADVAQQQQQQAFQQQGMAGATGGAAALAWNHLQLRWFAIRSPYRPKAKTGMPDRNLPARNEQIRAPQAGWEGLGAVSGDAVESFQGQSPVACGN